VSSFGPKDRIRNAVLLWEDPEEECQYWQYEWKGEDGQWLPVPVVGARYPRTNYPPGQCFILPEPIRSFAKDFIAALKARNVLPEPAE